jgi:hypothetical protein
VYKKTNTITTWAEVSFFGCTITTWIGSGVIFGCTNIMCWKCLFWICKNGTCAGRVLEFPITNHAENSILFGCTNAT